MASELASELERMRALDPVTGMGLLIGVFVGGTCGGAIAFQFGCFS